MEKRKICRYIAGVIPSALIFGRDIRWEMIPSTLASGSIAIFGSNVCSSLAPSG